MGYLGLVAIVGVGATIALGAFIGGALFAVKRKWKHVLICVGCLLGGIGIVAGTVVWSGVKLVRDVSTRVARGVAEQNARMERASLERKALTPKVDWSKVSDEFWNYPGVWDWYRVPLRYPYEMESIDLLDNGYLGKNIAGGKSDDPNRQVKSMSLRDVRSYAVDGDLMAYYRQEQDKVEKQWGIFHFEDERNEPCASEAVMWEKAEEAGWKGGKNLLSVQAQYEGYWSGK